MVHSAANTAGVFGVLLAIGYTSLAVEDRDMRALGGYRWPWRRVGPREFATIVREYADGDSELLRYADHLADEADDHERAVDAVRTCAPVSWGRDSAALSHWAYFSEVARLRRDTASWERSSLVSGALMTLWVADADNGESGFYLEFMGEGPRRSLCAKTWARGGEPLLASRRRLLELLDGLGGQPVKLPSATAKTCTAARFPLDDVSPADASRLVDRLVARIAG